MLGDLNCKHPHWDANCINSNKNGRNLEESAEKNDIIIHYTNEPTHFPFAQGQTPSTLDIAVAKNLPNIDNIRTIKTLTSDHDPVYLEIRTTRIIPRRQGQFHDYNKTDWKKYRNTLDNHIDITNNITDKISLEEEFDELTQAIITARNLSTKLFTRKQYEDDLPQEILDLINNKNYLRRR